MALKNIKIGQTTEQIVSNIVDNFEALDEGKEPAITKQTAFNKPFATTAPTENGTASAGTSETVARGDHAHPTDTSRLATSPDGTNPLLDGERKINPIYIPDSILGQLEYRGTWDASGEYGAETSDPQAGWYYICRISGSHNPEDKIDDFAQFYEVGDWAVYNGKTHKWDKVDNTDAVTMVNNRKGHVKTYQGQYVDATYPYYAGDTVSDSVGRIYVCIADTVLPNGGVNSSATLNNKTYWLPTGSIMGVKVNGKDVVGTDGVANIVLNLDEVAGTIVPATTVKYPINGIDYYGILISHTDTEFEVFVDSKKVVTQSFIDGNNIFIACAQSAGVTVEVRKLVGNVASSSKLYKHHLAWASGNDRYWINVDVINSYSGTLDTMDLLREHAQGSYSASGMVVVSDTEKNVIRVDIQAAIVKAYYLSKGTGGVPSLTEFYLNMPDDTVTEL